MKSTLKRFAALALALALICSVMLIPAAASNASLQQTNAVTATKLLKTAAAKIDAAKSITANFTFNRNLSDGNYEHWIGMVNIGKKWTHKFIQMTSNTYKRTWEEYQSATKVHQKFFGSSEWESYTDSNVRYTLSYKLKHMKNVKITSTTTSSYVVSGKPAWSGSPYKRIQVTIDKKSGQATKIKLYFGRYTEAYLNDTGYFTVTGGNETYSNIGYSKAAVTLPSELAGR